MINVVTNLPNEGVVVYQTAIVLVGAYITYKTLIKVENNEQNINDLKEAEIALLECKIDYETDPGSNKIKRLKKKRLRLRKEILLGCIQHTFKSESENKKICNYLQEEIRQACEQQHDAEQPRVENKENKESKEMIQLVEMHGTGGTEQ